jgi:hypothetical protein
MFLRKLGWVRLALGLILGVGLITSGAIAVAQPYQGDQFCGLCHKDHPAAWMNKYNDYMQHGHRWTEVQTRGQEPGADLFGLGSVTDAEGNAITTLPQPDAAFVAANRPDPNDLDGSGNPKVKVALLDTDGNPFVKADGKLATAIADLTQAQKDVAKKMQWSDVRGILGNFSGDGHYVLTSNGQRVTADPAAPAIWNTSATYSNMTKRCFRCHNHTGYSDVPTPDDDRVMYGTANVWRTRVGNGTTIPYEYWFNGAPAKDPFGNRISGIQCEHCHGPAGQMLNGAALNRKVCMDCHAATSQDAIIPSGGDPDQRIQAVVVSGVVTFPNHRPQGPEFRRSAHKAVRAKLLTQGGAAGAQADEYVEQGCVLCHDPHKSVWHEKGGIKFVGARADYATEEEYEHAVGNMCKECHQKTDHDAEFPADQQPKKVRIRGIMGEEAYELKCVDCHMPDISVSTTVANGRAVGAEGMHLWRIRTGPDMLAATDHVSPPINDVAYTRTYWLPTERDGDASMTLDLVCTKCHSLSHMPLDFMAEYAKGIHRQPGLVDVTVNGKDSLQVVTKNDVVSIGFSIEAGDKAGTKADCWVVCQGPKGWSSWNGKKWVAGFRPWRKGMTLADAPEQKVLNAKLPAGHYTYWVNIDAADGSEYSDSVPVYVKKK